MSEDLSTYLAISDKPFNSAENVTHPVRVDKLWFGLRKPLEEWPDALRKEWDYDLGWIFPQLSNREELPVAQQKVCLCIDVATCRFKTAGQRENRECSRFGNGICSEATWNALRDKPLSQAILAFFYGMSPKQLRALQEGCVRGWIRDILADPVLKEYIEHLGLSRV